MFQQLGEHRAGQAAVVRAPVPPPERRQVEVLSGNHRVQASVEAGIERILVMIIEEDLTRSQAVAIQLSHNALVGEDDPAPCRVVGGD